MEAGGVRGWRKQARRAPGREAAGCASSGLEAPPTLAPGKLSSLLPSPSIEAQVLIESSDGTSHRREPTHAPAHAKRGEPPTTTTHAHIHGGWVLHLVSSDLGGHKAVAGLLVDTTMSEKGLEVKLFSGDLLLEMPEILVEERPRSDRGV